MAKATEVSQGVVISAPNFKRMSVQIVGTSPLVMNKFSQKAREQMVATQELGTKAAKKGGAKPPKDFDACYEGAFHRSREGWAGIPAAAFRAAMVSACRATSQKMTIAKMAVFVEAQGFDVDEGTPLIKILGDPPKRLEMLVVVGQGGHDVRIRPMWLQWGCVVTIKYDADMFDPQSIINLLARAGVQVGVGEGRPSSKMSCGQGWGCFEVATEKKSK